MVREGAPRHTKTTIQGMKEEVLDAKNGKSTWRWIWGRLKSELAYGDGSVVDQKACPVRQKNNRLYLRESWQSFRRGGGAVSMSFTADAAGTGVSHRAVTLHGGTTGSLAH